MLANHMYYITGLIFYFAWPSADINYVLLYAHSQDMFKHITRVSFTYKFRLYIHVYMQCYKEYLL